ncbi:unnamed protein product [Clonostachys solani]|uniref:FAD-binding PCMH-type domain-containing protein n=1 Tax=Clonostachys solani TaxID=160281 RepID=A0A9N9ZBK7_9HYPO|nr:unnamed protein product [Clonostachys solani]
MSLKQCLRAVCGIRLLTCVSFAGDPLYQLAWVKPFNLDIPVTPAAVIRPNTAEEVAGAVKCAKQYNVAIQAKSGGHSYGNFGLGGEDGAVAVDLVNLKSFSMDESTWMATYGSGLRHRDLDAYLHNNGARAIAHGTCPSVGVGGHATIGGLGPMSRMWGSALDHVEEVEVVTADGEIRRASYTENADLFFGIKGAGASFGIVTKFKVHTHPEPGNVVEYTYNLSFGSQKEMASVFKKWQALAGDPELDRRFSTLFFAQPLGALITGTFYGTEEEYKATGIQDKIPSGGVVDFKLVSWLGSIAHQAEVAGLGLAELPNPFTSRSLAFREEDLLSDAAVDDLFTYLDEADKGTIIWTLIFNSEGGAMADFTEGNSYPHRDKVMMYQSYVIGIPEVSDTSKAFVEEVQRRVRAGAPNANTTYAGYIDPTLDRQAANQFYWGDKLPQLREAKKKWDPSNIFRNPQSVEPAS